MEEKPTRGSMERKKRSCRFDDRHFENCGFRDFRQDFWPGFAGCHICAEIGAIEPAAVARNKGAASMAEAISAANDRFAAQTIQAPVNSIVAAIATAHALEAGRKGAAESERSWSIAKETSNLAAAR